MVWSILPTPVVHERKSWEERFQDLLKYKEAHGHMRVPQRLVIVKVRIFTWKWILMFHDITISFLYSISYPGLGAFQNDSCGMFQFKSNTIVLTQYYIHVGNWVHAQRVGYHLLKKGETSRLNTPKALKLAEVGFEFVVAPNKRKGSRQNLYNPIPHVARRAAEQAAAAANNNNNDENNVDNEEESSDEDDIYEEEDEREVTIQPQQRAYTSSWYIAGPTYM